MKEIEKSKRRLLKLLTNGALKTGKIKLSSGKTSSYYIDAKQVTMDPEGAWLTAKIFFEMLKHEEFDAIGGLAIGADPIVTAIAVYSHLKRKPIPIFIVRKEPKKHGMQKYIEGVSLKARSRVVIIDDVMTSGQSALKAIEAVKNNRCKIVKVMALVDRLEGAKENLRRHHYKLVSVFTKGDLIDAQGKPQTLKRTS